MLSITLLLGISSNVILIGSWEPHNHAVWDLVVVLPIPHSPRHTTRYFYSFSWPSGLLSCLPHTSYCLLFFPPPPLFHTCPSIPLPPMIILFHVLSENGDWSIHICAFPLLKLHMVCEFFMDILNFLCNIHLSVSTYHIFIHNSFGVWVTSLRMIFSISTHFPGKKNKNKTKNWYPHFE